LSTRTLTRTEDFVVIKGGVGSLAGAETADLRLYSCRSAGCSPVPVQVDKVDAEGRYVFPQDTENQRDGSKLDDNDEICFMAGDAGDRRPGGWKPEAATKVVEIELRDPLDNGVAWLYLVNEPGAPAPEIPDYVSYRVDENNVFIQSPRFVIGYRKGRINYDLMRMLTPSGELGADVLDRQRVGLEAQFAGDMKLALSAPESIIKGYDVAVIDGPVRVIVDTVVSIHIGAYSIMWGTEYFNKFYRCGQNNMGRYEFPTSLKELFRTVMLYWSLDFTQDILGSSYIDEHHLEPAPIKDEVRDEVPGDKDHFWWGLYGQEGALLEGIKMAEDIRPYMTCSGRWKQNPNPNFWKGDHPGRLDIGFNCHEIKEMPDMKVYSWMNYILFPENPTPQELISLKNIFEHPLEIEVKDLT
jgi:hypothetical protein